MPKAPASSTGLASQGSLHGTRTIGTAELPLVAAIMACAVARSIGPCSMSMIRASTPLAASTCTIATLGMVTMKQVAQPPAASLALRGLMADMSRWGGWLPPPPGVVPAWRQSQA